MHGDDIRRPRAIAPGIDAALSGKLRVPPIVAYAVGLAVLLAAHRFSPIRCSWQRSCASACSPARSICSGRSVFCRSATRLSSGPAPTWRAMPLKVWGLPFELAALIGTAAATVLGVVFGYVAIRRQGLYFAMITLALAQMIYFLALQASVHARRGRTHRRSARPHPRAVRSQQPLCALLHDCRHLPRRLSPDLSHHAFHLRTDPQGDPREGAARNLARLSGQRLQARSCSCSRRRWPALPVPPRPWWCSSPRSPTCTGARRATSF